MSQTSHNQPCINTNCFPLFTSLTLYFLITIVNYFISIIDHLLYVICIISICILFSSDTFVKLIFVRVLIKIELNLIIIELYLVQGTVHFYADALWACHAIFLPHNGSKIA